tara:strand:+ start:186 stop:323 length:138 start_codon:yes stop_codon:yes gene_type:complete
MVVAINIAYKVPDDKADEVHAIFKEHFAWMDKFYQVSLPLEYDPH